MVVVLLFEFGEEIVWGFLGSLQFIVDGIDFNIVMILFNYVLVIIGDFLQE